METETSRTGCFTHEACDGTPEGANQADGEPTGQDQKAETD